MLLSELRNLLKKYDENDLKVLVVEMYKSMPKKLRQEKEIDRLVEDVNKTKDERKTKKSKIDFELLKYDVEIFIEYAYKQYYFAPNNFVHKKERPKWRFKVKGFINVLSSVSIYSEDSKVATELLEKIYSMLCYACAYYLFNTDDPFKSVGIDSGEFLEIIITRRFGDGIDAEAIKSVISLVVKSESERSYTKATSLYRIVGYLKTIDSKEIAIEQCKSIKTEITVENQTRKRSWNSSYWYDDKMNAITEFVVALNLEISESENGIKYFRKYYIEKNKEVALYVLLQLLFEYDLTEYWVSEYEKALKKDVSPRKTLQETYKKIKEKI